MSKSFQITGIERKQHFYLLFFSLMTGFLIGGLIFFLIVKYFMEQISDPELTVFMFSSVMIGASLMTILAILCLSCFMKMTWAIKLTPIGFSIKQGNKAADFYTISQLKIINFIKVKTLMGFNLGVQLQFDSKIVDVQIIYSPIIPASNQQDKDQFRLFIDYLYSHIIEQKFELQENNMLFPEILETLTDKGSTEHKFTFIKKQLSF
ncbi:hypothetical protein RHO13_00210 [Orbus wheelerorum]|uniref:hypothetical protein n=1 Tax=Orbus wheelerorum TaxID=3074111 RepID=UPI00370D9C1C